MWYTHVWCMYGCLPLSPLYLTLDNKGLTESGAHCLIRSIFLTACEPWDFRSYQHGFSHGCWTYTWDPMLTQREHTNMAFHTGAGDPHFTPYARIAGAYQRGFSHGCWGPHLGPYVQSAGPLASELVPDFFNVSSETCVVGCILHRGKQTCADKLLHLALG